MKKRCRAKSDHTKSAREHKSADKSERQHRSVLLNLFYETGSHFAETRDNRGQISLFGLSTCLLLEFGQAETTGLA